MPAPLTLQPHPASPCAAVTQLAVHLEGRPDGGLQLRYRMGTGANSCPREAAPDAGAHKSAPALLLPTAPAAPTRADNLWQHTCCELFVGDAASPAYREFNFSPAGAWAAYDFAGYRQRVADPDLPPPQITLRQLPDGLEVQVELAAAALPPWAANARLGLSCVTAASDGSRAYWALAHPAGQPDFHHAAGWTSLLPALLPPRLPPSLPDPQP